MRHELKKLPPPRLARVMEAVRDRLQRLHRRSVPPQVALLELVTASWLSQAIYAAAKLGVADLLEDEPLSAEALAQALGADREGIYRLLRALAPSGVFRQLDDGRFAQTPLSAALRSDADGSLRGFVLYVGSPEHRAHWSRLDAAVRTGKDAIPALRGMPFFDYVQRDRDFGSVFDGAMTSVSDLAQRAVLSAYDFAPYRSIVDLGGGQGRLLSAILAGFPRARGVLYDLPEVVVGAADVLARAGVASRCTVESGSFFEHVPRGGDAYLLKHIVHDWADAHACAILRNVRAACMPDSRLLLIESVLPEDGTPHPAKLFDLEMLLSVGGRERTEREFRSLLARADFALERIVPTASPLAILEARPC